MLLVLLAYSVLFLYLSNANYRSKWWNRNAEFVFSCYSYDYCGVWACVRIDRQENMSSSAQGDRANGVSMRVSLR